MKSKKKLIYKLHENMQKNPFKPIQEISMRSVGVQLCNFNRLRSIRSMSLNSINAAHITDKLNQRLNQKKIFQVKSEKPYFFSIKNKLQLGDKGKKIKINADIIKFQKNRLDLYKKLRQKEGQNEQKDEIIKQTPQSLQSAKEIGPGVDKNITQISFKHQKSIPGNRPYQLLQKNSQTKNSSSILLPALCHKKNENNQPNVNKQIQSTINQQNTKQQICKHLLLIQQQKKNKQILMMIKQKSNKNLQKMTRSHSQVIVVDKWKQKYYQNRIEKELKGQKQFTPLGQYATEKNLKHQNELEPARQNKSRKLNRNIEKTRIFLPQIHRNKIQLSQSKKQDIIYRKKTQLKQIEYDSQVFFTNQSYQIQMNQYLTEYENTNLNVKETEQSNLRINQYNRRFSFQEFDKNQELSNYQSCQIMRYENQKSQNILNQDQIEIQSSQNILYNKKNQNQSKKINQVQSIKINITKMSRYETKNGQNLNLSQKNTQSLRQRQKLPKLNRKKQNQTRKQKQKQLKIQNSKLKVQMFKQQERNQIQRQQTYHQRQQKYHQSQQNYYQSEIQPIFNKVQQVSNKISNNQQKTFFLKEQKYINKLLRKQTIQSDNKMLQRLVQGGILMRWQHYKNRDLEQDYEFGDFVKDKILEQT